MCCWANISSAYMIMIKLLTVYSLIIVSAVCLHQGEEQAKYFTNEWIVRIEGGPQVAELLAVQLGYHLVGDVVGFPDTYRMVKNDHPIQRKRGHPQLTKRLADDVRVVWAEQQFAKERQKRDVIPESEIPLIRVRRSADEVEDYENINNINAEIMSEADYDGDYDLYKLLYPEYYQNTSRRFNDELWDQQWYMQDTRSRPDLPKLDLHVIPCYDMGITGKGVRVTVLDDGLEYTHSDLKDNYDPEISFDANDGDPDPTPRVDENKLNSHGTRCAGEIAMAANNGKCGVGIAYNAKLGGVRMLDGEVNDRVEGVGLGFAYDKIDIYSASWGPNDDGKTLEGPGRLAREAIERGVTKGRNGKGVIFVWASGNGGGQKDNCNCDGYAASIYTLSIGSASQQGSFPWYGERCSATFAATYSSGAFYDQMIATTDLQDQCTVKHTGTSAAAPLAAGIIALALEVNPSLTWRDVQHLVAWTSEYAPLADNPGWQRNSAGYWINTRFGFGLMNAHNLVLNAANWTTVPDKSTCSIVTEDYVGENIKSKSPKNVLFSTKSCDTIKYLEHVELEANIEYPIRGAIEIHLTSPSGTIVQLLSPRRKDKSGKGFRNWKLMSVLTWNENPSGTWVATIIDRISKEYLTGKLGRFTLHLHGTQEMPEYLVSGARHYNYQYNKVHRKSIVSSVTPTTVEKLKINKHGDLGWRDLIGKLIAV